MVSLTFPETLDCWMLAGGQVGLDDIEESGTVGEEVGGKAEMGGAMLASPVM